jgi:hypothetical protein
MSKSIYYLPGHGGLTSTGLGEELLKRGFDVSGRETVGEFRKLPFQEQIDLIKSDLLDLHWSEDARVIANSFGAYLFLHAQAQLSAYPGRVLLLSPIVGQFSHEESMRFFVPPRSGKLQALVDSGAFASPRICEIHVGENDWQSIPENVIALMHPLGIEVVVVPENGHHLDRAYVSALIDVWLS